MARSRARFFRIDSAFPASAPGRRHIGPFEACSSFTRVTACQVARPPFCGLCREVPTRPVSRPNRSPAIESNHQLFEWVLPPLVICPFRAHAEACPTSRQRILRTSVRLGPEPMMNGGSADTGLPGGGAGGEFLSQGDDDLGLTIGVKWYECDEL